MRLLRCSHYRSLSELTNDLVHFKQCFKFCESRTRWESDQCSPQNMSLAPNVMSPLKPRNPKLRIDCKTISLNKKGDFIPSKLLLLWCCSLTSCIHTAISFHNHCNFSVFMVFVKQSPFSHLIPTHIYLTVSWKYHQTRSLKAQIWVLSLNMYLCLYLWESLFLLITYKMSTISLALFNS